MESDSAKQYDVVVIGGGAAGLSGALTLARARRSVLVIDAGQPRNAPAAGVHGFLSRDGVPPRELVELGRAEVRRYDGEITAGTAVAAVRNAEAFTVTLDSGASVHARRLLVTTGLADELPDVPGLRERWGRDVLHCPYCHGWEVRDQPIGVLATRPHAVMQALLFRQWSADVTLFVHTATPPSVDEAEQLEARGVVVVTGEVAEIETDNNGLSGVRLRDGRTIPRRAIVVGPRFVARADLLRTLGLQPTQHPFGLGEYIEAGAGGLTAVPGVYVAGNVTDLMVQAQGAAAGGTVAAGAINNDLITEETQAAVDARRATVAVR